MNLTLLGRNIVCLNVAALPAGLLRELEDELELGPPTGSLSNPQLTLAQYRDVQIVSTPDRLQIEFPSTATRPLIRRVTSRILQVVDPYRPTAIGFNASVRIDLEEGEADPLADVVDEQVVGDRLGGTGYRFGGKIIWTEAPRVTWTLSFDLAANEDSVWIAGVNVNHDDRATAAAPEVLDWFGTSGEWLEARIEALYGEGVGGADG